MKFFEFLDTEYYALIGAKSSGEATEYYCKTLNDETGHPIEIGKQKVKDKIDKFVSNQYAEIFKGDRITKGRITVVNEACKDAIKEFEQDIEQPKPVLILHEEP